MSKTQNNILNLLTIILLNIAFWVCNGYPRHILVFESTASIVSVLLNLIFFIVFDYVLILASSKNKSLFSQGIFHKESLKKLSALIIVQLIFDGIAICISQLDLQWECLVIDILIPFQWIVNYFIITHNSKKHFKISKASVIIFLTLLIVSLCIDRVILSDYLESALKYEAGSDILDALKINAEFVYSIKLLIADSLFGVLFIILHGIDVTDNTNQKNNPTKAILRVVILITAVLILTLTKIHFWPNGAIVSMNTHNKDRQTYDESGEFAVKGKDFEIYRFSLKAGGKALCYGGYNSSVIMEGMNPVSIKPPVDGIIYKYDSENSALLENKSPFKEFNVGTEKAFIYNSQVICFYENNLPYAIPLDKLESAPENSMVTEICKKSLEDGNVYIFEYCCDYLLKYDKAFIDEYIERYSNGSFTSIESQWMSKNFYKPEYVTELAKEIK